MINEIERHPPRRALDFGCGAGVLLPALIRSNAEVVACDVNLTAATHMGAKKGWLTVHWAEGIERLRDLPSAGFDMITCLDVLEHLGTLSEVTREFRRLLAPDGRLIVCGPTESALYRLGRFLAGLSGDYHVRNIYDIERHLTSLFRCQRVERLIWPATLFRISFWENCLPAPK